MDAKKKTKRRKQLSSRSGILRLRSRVRRPTPCELNKLWKTVTYTNEKQCWTSINELMEGRKNNTGGQKSIFIYLSCHLQADTSGRNAGLSCQSIKKTQFMKITDLGKVNRVVALTISYFCSCVLNLSYSVVQKLWASAVGRSFPSYPAFL